MKNQDEDKRKMFFGIWSTAYIACDLQGAQLQLTLYATQTNALITAEIYLIMMDAKRTRKTAKTARTSLNFSFSIFNKVLLGRAALFRLFYQVATHKVFKSAVFSRIKPPTVNVLIKDRMVHINIYDFTRGIVIDT